eukprot:gene8114-9641_t
MRVYIHLEEEPALTVLYKFGSADDDCSISDILQFFVDKHRAKHGTILSRADINLFSAKGRQLNADSIARKILSNQEDVFVRRKDPAKTGAGSAKPQDVATTSSIKGEEKDGQHLVSSLLAKAKESDAKQNYQHAALIYEELNNRKFEKAEKLLCVAVRIFNSSVKKSIVEYRATFC